MTYACPMCGRSFEWEDDFGGRGPIVCPACGAAVDGIAAVFAASDRATAERRVQAPAVALMVVGGLTILNGLAGVAMAILFVATEPEGGGPFEDEFNLIGPVLQAAGALVSFAVGGVIIAGGLKMYRLRLWGLALAASILSVIPCMVCFLFGLPVGIWSLVTLNDPEVKEAFR